MSEPTPRTSEFMEKMCEELAPDHWQEAYFMALDFARTLERENAELRAELELMTGCAQRAQEAEARLTALVGEERERDFLARLRLFNKERCEQNFKHAITAWNIMEWGCALAGEAGELCNVLKKVKREQDGIAGSRIEGDGQKAIADELADVIIYADLLAQHCGIDLASAIASKFNETSAKVGYNRALSTPREGGE